MVANLLDCRDENRKYPANARKQEKVERQMSVKVMTALMTVKERTRASLAPLRVPLTASVNCWFAGRAIYWLRRKRHVLRLCN